MPLPPSNLLYDTTNDNRSTMSLTNRIVTILFEGVPSHLDYHLVKEELEKIPGVEDVHCLHIWSISSTACALTVHLKVLAVVSCVLTSSYTPLPIPLIPPNLPIPAIPLIPP